MTTKTPELEARTTSGVERVTADQLEPGDVFADRRDVAAANVLVEIESIGDRSRWLVFRPAAGSDAATTRIRPRHTTKFWRWVEAVDQEQPETKPSRKTSKPSETETKPAGADDTKTEPGETKPTKAKTERLEHDLATATAGELGAERLQINNRLSGLKTRLKRSEPGVVQKGLLERIAALTERRAAIGAELKRRAS